MNRNFWLDYGWVIVWAIGLAVALAIRPLLPSDETRYVSAAWEMWTRGDFLVPYLNGQTYSHKPPLMFWSIQAGWSLFGVNDWWPRLVSPLAGVAAIFTTRALARQLWPTRPEIAQLVPWLLTGTLFWNLFSTVTMFDMWNALFASFAMLGVVRAAIGRMVSGFVILGVAIGLGVLAKGPVILLYTLPPVVLAPWWMPQSATVRWHHWYVATLCAILLGAAIALSWAIPAALAGGDDYARAIFWSQTAGRLEKSYAHSRPVWWYLPMLPVMLFPWIFWPRLWRGGFALPGRDSWPLRLAIIWWLPTFVAFCFISGKQPHYLLPLFPAFALMAAARLCNDSAAGRRVQWLPGLVTLVTGIVLILVPVSYTWYPEIWQGVRVPFWLADVSPVAGIVLLLASVFIIRRAEGQTLPILKMSLLAPLLMILVHLFVFRAAAPAYDLKTVSQQIGVWQSEGRPVAWRKKYHSQFHFLGRLTTPIQVVKNRALEDWFAQFPDGIMIMTHKGAPPGELQPLHSQPFRGNWLAVWDSRSYRAGHQYFR